MAAFLAAGEKGEGAAVVAAAGPGLQGEPPETALGIPIMEATRTGRIEHPPLVHWDAWQVWRKGPGAYPKGLPREDYYRVAARESLLHYDTMTALHGFGWKDRRLEEQGPQHKPRRDLPLEDGGPGPTIASSASSEARAARESAPGATAAATAAAAAVPVSLQTRRL